MALRIKPDYADAHANWGLALARQGKPAEAIEHYHQALKLRPSFPEAQSNLAKALQELGRRKEALGSSSSPGAAPSRKGHKAE